MANEIVLVSKPFSNGGFVKGCILKCSEKQEAIANITLTGNMIADKTLELSEDFTSQLKQRVGCFIAFSVAIDESTDIMDAAQLLALWKTQMESGDPAHFPHQRNVFEERSNIYLKQCKDKMARILADLNKQFQVFDELERKFSVISSPFTVKAISLPVDIHLEIIDLQCDSDLKE
ncbi:unnamed protein product [Lepeophtheirus salmonis]|uniref:(salmon louse) hypothetical protein n=1 Tax=Lepeophtheirus salmonis TaxID=72036 RepID=A0A7R8CHY4_LEPSM|nr:unnamed protein product [Lepeophtheirus salmonis]CAF2827777.1 unnamed protein product [Lepeophtheirus salmonis]